MTDNQEGRTGWMSEGAQNGLPRTTSHVRLPTASWFTNQNDNSAAVAAYRANHFSAAILASTGVTEPLLPLRTAPDLLLQTVVILGAPTAEGRIIEAIAIPWFDIIKLLSKDSNAVFQIPSSKWEELIAGAYKQAGFEEVTLTPRSGDHGRDVIAIKKGLGSIRIIDQVKAYKPGHLVTAKDVQALVGTLQGDGASKGFLTTTSDFAPRIAKNPLIIPLMPSRLELINGPKLIARLEELATRPKP